MKARERFYTIEETKIIEETCVDLTQVVAVRASTDDQTNLPSFNLYFKGGLPLGIPWAVDSQRDTQMKEFTAAWQACLAKWANEQRGKI